MCFSGGSLIIDVIECSSVSGAGGGGGDGSDAAAQLQLREPQSQRILAFSHSPPSTALPTQKQRPKILRSSPRKEPLPYSRFATPRSRNSRTARAHGKRGLRHD